MKRPEPKDYEVKVFDAGADVIFKATSSYYWFSRFADYADILRYGYLLQSANVDKPVRPATRTAMALARCSPKPVASRYAPHKTHRKRKRDALKWLLLYGLTSAAIFRTRLDTPRWRLTGSRDFGRTRSRKSKLARDASPRRFTLYTLIEH
jgi:hypothetical protein